MGNVEPAREKAAKYMQKREQGPKDESEDGGVRIGLSGWASGKGMELWGVGEVETAEAAGKEVLKGLVYLEVTSNLQTSCKGRV